jgi:hypothetical protein
MLSGRVCLGKLTLQPVAYGQVSIPSSDVGKFIGRRGSNVNDLIARLKSHCQEKCHNIDISVALSVIGDHSPSARPPYGGGGGKGARGKGKGKGGGNRRTDPSPSPSPVLSDLNGAGSCQVGVVDIVIGAWVTDDDMFLRFKNRSMFTSEECAELSAHFTQVLRATAHKALYASSIHNLKSKRIRYA